MREVMLYGGPADGQRIAWDGGDIIKLASRPSMVTVSGSPSDPGKPTMDDHTYRQSIKDRDVFVYQP